MAGTQDAQSGKQPARSTRTRLRSGNGSGPRSTWPTRSTARLKLRSCSSAVKPLSHRFALRARRLSDRAETHLIHSGRAHHTTSSGRDEGPLARATPGGAVAANERGLTQGELPVVGSRQETGVRPMTTHDEPTSSRQAQEPGSKPDPASVADVRLRDLMNELSRIQDRLTAEGRATGARPSPGSNRRRAELLRRERDVIRQLRARPDRPTTMS